MRFLADENVPRRVLDALLTKGVDVLAVRDQAPGSGDEEVLRWAVREQRVLLTFDKDFGELVFRRGKTASCGLVLFRLSAMAPEELAHFVPGVLALNRSWEGSFTVVESDRIRVRELP